MVKAYYFSGITTVLTLLILVVAPLVVAAPTARAEMPSSHGEIQEFYTGVRSLGMGGAYVNTVNDETALLSNPAGLGKLRDFTTTMIDPELSGSFSNTDMVNYTNFTDTLEIQGLLKHLNQFKGKRWHSKFQMFPSFVAPGFGIGILAKYEMNGMVDAAGTKYELDYVNDFALALGYNFRFFGGLVKIGVGGRLVNRSEIHDDLDPGSVGLKVKDLASEGVGIALDTGIILTAPLAGLPALGLSVRDAGNTTYDFREGFFASTSERPRATPQTVDAALSFQPILGNQVRSTIAFEYHGVLTPLVDTQETYLKRTHIGAEINLSDFVFIRAGANQGYWTAGLEFATPRMQLQLACYGEEVGVPGSSREDRRWVTKFSFRF